MISNVIASASSEAVKRGHTSQKLSVHWRHYISGTGFYTLYSTGATTAFPYAYGGIAVPYNGYFSKFMMASMPYSTRQNPSGNLAQLQVYVNGVLKSTKFEPYSTNVRESVIFNFGQEVPINIGETVTLRFQGNGQWWYCVSTSIITER